MKNAEFPRLTQWQLDALLRRRTDENIKRSRETLTSTVRLVNSIRGLPVGEAVRNDVTESLNSLAKAG